MDFETILVPLDGSALAEAALPHAIALGRQGACVILVRAVEAHPAPTADATEAQVKVVREAEEYLARVKERLALTGVTGIETSVWYGSAAKSIIEAARFRKADLIVMSSHGRSGLGRLVLGSVAEAVLRGTKTPILLTRDATAPLMALNGPVRPARESARVLGQTEAELARRREAKQAIR